MQWKQTHQNEKASAAAKSEYDYAAFLKIVLKSIHDCAVEYVWCSYERFQQSPEFQVRNCPRLAQENSPPGTEAIRVPDLVVNFSRRNLVPVDPFSAVQQLVLGIGSDLIYRSNASLHYSPVRPCRSFLVLAQCSVQLRPLVLARLLF